MTILAIALASSVFTVKADDEKAIMAAKLVEEARAALKKDDARLAIELAAKAAALDPRSSAAFIVLGVAHLSLRHNDEAAKALAEAVKLDPRSTLAHDRLGDALLKSGQFKEAVAEFDEAIKLSPEIAPHHWRRGIALYYAGKFDEGKKQFDLHRTVNPEDVENSAWHYLCNARATTPKQARADLIPVSKDARVPMKQVLELFAGKLQPADVIEAAEKAKLEGDRLRDARFYAHLYVALYYESEGDAKKALDHLATAVEKYKNGDYMWDVAAAHLKAAQVKR